MFKKFSFLVVKVYFLNLLFSFENKCCTHFAILCLVGFVDLKFF